MIVAIAPLGDQNEWRLTDYGACDQGDPSLDSGGGDPNLGPAPDAGPSPTPVDSPPPDSPTPPDSGLDSGRTHCMCADPVERPMETIPIREIFGAIFDPISVPAPTDERFPIELGGDGLQIMVAGPGGGGLLINVRWPGGLGILKSSGAGPVAGTSGSAGTGSGSSGGSGVIYVDPRGNAIPVPPGGSITTSPDGRWIQVRDANGNPTGARIDNGHPDHSDPRAQDPHAHVPGVTNPDGTPWLPIAQ